jgi:uncharacterized protein (DUF1800 family)
VSEFICLKLYRYFVSDLPGTPDKARRDFIVRLAKQFRGGGHNVKPVLKRLFTSEHFYATENRAGLIKSPVQLVLQALRSLRTPVRNVPALLSACDLMGQNLFYPPSVKGWDGGRSWINTSTLFVRQNVLIYLLTGARPEGYRWRADRTEYDATHLVAHLAGAGGGLDPEASARYVLQFTTGREAEPERVGDVEIVY